MIPYKIKQIETCFSKLNEKWDRKFKCNFCAKEYADISGRRRHEKRNILIKVYILNAKKIKNTNQKISQKNKSQIKSLNYKFSGLVLLNNKYLLIKNTL